MKYWLLLAPLLVRSNLSFGSKLPVMVTADVAELLAVLSSITVFVKCGRRVQHVDDETDIGRHLELQVDM